MRPLLILMLISLAFGARPYAQCYDVSNVSYYPHPHDGGTAVNLSDDSYSEILDLGFDFCFFGDTVNRFTIASNGFISFDSTTANLASPWHIDNPIPDSTLPVFAIMNAFMDLNPSNDPLINYKTVGNAPHRKTIISYANVPGFGCPSTDPDFTGQIVMHETSNVIDLFIYSKPFCSNWNEGHAIQGIQNQDGTVGLATPGRNHPDQWSTFEDGKRFTPLCNCPTEAEPEPPTIHSINGNVYHDLNSNCSFSTGELTIPNVRLEIGPNAGFAWTNNNGEFRLDLDTGDYSLTQSILNPSWMQYVCPGQAIPFSIESDLLPTPLFLGNAPELTTDLRINFANSALRPCNLSQQVVQVCNDGTQPAFNVLVNLSINDPDSLLIPYPDGLWHNAPGLYNHFYAVIDTLPALSCVRLELIDSVICFTGNKQQMCFEVSVTALPNETDLLNNSATFCEKAVNFSSNHKRVLSRDQPPHWITVEAVERPFLLDYLIRFQNTGTDTVRSIFIRDTLHYCLDQSTVEPIISSHDHFTQLIDDELLFSFPNINLPPSQIDELGSQGFVRYRVLLTGLCGLVQVTNTATIQYDQGYPNPTNTTVNTVVLFNGLTEKELGAFSLFPNPTNHEVFILSDDPLLKIETLGLVDAQGKLLLSQVGNLGTNRIDLSNLSTGIYLLRIQTEKGIQAERVIKN